MKKNLIYIALLLMLALPVMAIGEKPSNTTLPDLTLTTYDNQELALSDMIGQPIIIHFWATWSPPALGDMLILQALHDDLGDEILVIGINHFDEDETALEFLSDNDITYVTVPDTIDGEFAIAFDLVGAPQTYVYDRDGVLVQNIEMPLNREELTSILEREIDLIWQAESIIDAPVPPALDRRYADIPFSISDEGYPILGNTDAPIMIQDFSSFACPFCRMFHREVFIDLIDFFRDGDVVFTYIPIYTTGSLPYSLEANVAALCASEQDQFWYYMDMLFDWHLRFGDDAFLPERLRQGAINLEFDIDAWDACIIDEAQANILENALVLMDEQGATGTPAIFINGLQVSATLDSIVETIEQLRGART